MYLLWGFLMTIAGLFMLICGRFYHDFVVYQLIAARSRILWGDNVHYFYQISGAMVIIFGVLVAFGYISTSKKLKN